VDQTTDPFLTKLKNATYFGIEEQDPVTLKDGLWEGEPIAEGGSSRPRVQFLRDFHRLGDPEGDGVDEAGVVLTASAGGTGENSYVAVVGLRDGELKNLDTVLIGDRVQIRKAGVLENRLFLELLRAGPEDAMCCPGELAIVAWSLKNDKLEAMEATSVPVRLSVESIAGPEWVLRWWDLEEKAPVEPEVTLNFVEGRLAGKSGCNNWFTTPEAGKQPGDLTVGPMGGTMMMCPDDVMDVERKFLGQMEGVKKYGFMAGMLALTYEVNGESGVMLFEGRTSEK
jgi:heat shock protein HslJ